MITRVRKQRGFTVVDNGYLYDPSLTLEAVGLLTIIFSYPDDRMITIESIAENRQLDTPYKVRNAMKVLLQNGYCKRTKRQDGKGIFRGWDYKIFEEKQPLTDLPNTQVGEATDVRNTDVGKTSVNISTISNITIDSSKTIDSNVDKDLLLNTGEIFENKIFPISETEEISNPTIQKEERKSCAKKKEVAPLIPIPDNLNTPEFIDAWTRLCSLSKWRKKEASALETALKKLSKFDVRFAIDLCENAHSGNYQGVVFTDTPTKYEQWKKRNPHEQQPQQGFRSFAQSAADALDEQFRGTHT